MSTVDLNEPGCTPDEHSRGKQKVLGSPAQFEKAARLFRAISDPPRLMLVAQLAQREICVTELAGLAGESLSTISQRLRVLRAENIVVRKRTGKHINYALADQHVIDLVRNALVHVAEPGVDEPESETAKERRKYEQKIQI